jgi:hypothetical protein
LSDLAVIQAADPAPSLLPGMLIFILLVATVLALLASFGLLRLYRRAVLRSMGARSRPRADEHVFSDTPAASGLPVRAEPDLAVLDRDTAIAPGAPAETLYSEALYAPWRTAGIYVVAGFSYAVVMAAAFLASTQLEFSPMRFLIMFWVYAWPVVLTVNLVAVATRRAKLATVLVYFLVYAALGTIARSPALDWGQIALLWLTIDLPPTVLVLAFLNRRVRAVGPLVLVFMILAVTGSQLALSIVGSNSGLISSIAELGVNFGFNALGHLHRPYAPRPRRVRADRVADLAVDRSPLRAPEAERPVHYPRCYLARVRHRRVYRAVLRRGRVLVLRPPRLRRLQAYLLSRSPVAGA